MKLLDLVREDLSNHGGEWTRPGFRALAAHRYGNWCQQIEKRLIRGPFMLLYWMAYRRCRNVYGIELPYSATVGRGVIIEHQGGIVVHGNTVIGDGCIIRQGCTLGNRHLDKPLDAPVLGKNVNVGAGACLLGKVMIGDNASIGANSVVLSDVAQGVTVAGIPAKPLS